jgi:lipid A 3-O-deacylase
MQTKSRAFLLAAALAALVHAPASRADWRPDGVMFQGGGGGDDVNSVASAGLLWDWDWQLRRRALVTAHTELILSNVRVEGFTGERSIQQVTLLPTLRMQLNEGGSRWFLEFGIGAGYFNHDFVSPGKVFSTRWNFYDVLGAGYRFGDAARHELGLRYVHNSNADIRKPNPGQDFLLLRYAYRF